MLRLVRMTGMGKLICGIYLVTRVGNGPRLPIMPDGSAKSLPDNIDRFLDPFLMTLRVMGHGPNIALDKRFLHPQLHKIIPALNEEIGQCRYASFCDDGGQLEVKVVHVAGEFPASDLFESHLLRHGSSLVTLTDKTPLLFGRVRNVISMSVKAKRNRAQLGNREIPFLWSR